MSILPITSLRAFEAAARYESFVEAAAELRVSAAAISQHVRALEAWLGRPLFERHARGVSLTDAGRSLGSAVTHGLGLIETEAMHLRTPAEPRAVSIACIPSVMTRWLIPRLGHFRRRHPGIRVHLIYALDARSPDDAGADLLICHGLRPGADATLLLSAATRPTCSHDFLARSGPVRTVADMAQCELLHDETPSAWARWFAAAKSRRRVAAGDVFADFNLLVGAVLSGQGIGLCPTALIAPELARGTLVTLSDIATDLDKSYWLSAAPRAGRDARILCDWLMAEAHGAEAPTGRRAPTRRSSP